MVVPEIVAIQVLVVVVILMSDSSDRISNTVEVFKYFLFVYDSIGLSQVSYVFHLSSIWDSQI